MTKVRKIKQKNPCDVSNFDTDLVLQEWPTVLAGTLALLTIKTATLGLATRVPEWMEPNRLPAADAVRISLLLAGGGEFAFVVLALATKLDVVPTNLGALLTAIILMVASERRMAADRFTGAVDAEVCRGAQI